jgi:hypothetical protein
LFHDDLFYFFINGCHEFSLQLRLWTGVRPTRTLIKSHGWRTVVSPVQPGGEADLH